MRQLFTELAIILHYLAFLNVLKEVDREVLACLLMRCLDETCGRRLRQQGS
jgi:hypothetical protein